MKQLPLKLQVPILMMLICLISSCSTDSPDNPANEDLSANKVLENTAWTTRNFDFTIADDYSWAYTFTEITNIYFYSLSEGVFYYSRRINDSDTGRKRDTRVCFFKYHVKGNTVELDPITDEFSEFERVLYLSGNNVKWGDDLMKKKEMTYDDKKWLNDISGNVGNLKWYYDMQSSLYVVGSGAIQDFSNYKNTPWKSKDVYYSNLVIGEDITEIGSNAFSNVALCDVRFEGEKITEIGSRAFEGACLGKLDLPDNLKTIGVDAFYNCKHAEITLPESIEVIEGGALANCKSVDMYKTPHLRILGDNALSDTEIISWTDSEVLESIGANAVEIKNSSISLPAIKKLGPVAIAGDRLKEIHIGNTLSEVNGYAFSCPSSGKVYINQGTPLPLQCNLIIEGVDRWTLYVPKGSESAYKNAPYWKNFKSIVGSSDLDDPGNQGGNETINELLSRLNVSTRTFTATLTGSFTDQAYNQCKSFELRFGSSYGLDKYSTVKLEGQNFGIQIVNLNANTEYYYRIVATTNDGRTITGEMKSFTTNPPKAPSSCTYTIDGKTFKMVKVTGLSSGDFYIMQTEIPISSEVSVLNHSAVRMDKNLDNAVIKAEFRDFLNAVRNATDIEFRLPTSTEWVYAAKGGQYSKGYKYSGSNTLGNVGWFKDNSDNILHFPAKLSANELGLYDMSGNYGEIVHTSGDQYDVDGDVYGGWYKSTAANCMPQSHISQPSGGQMAGFSNIKEKNAFNGKYYTVRLVYSAR